MEKIDKDSKTALGLSILFFLSLGLGQLGITMFFTIKPYMIVTGVIAIYTLFHKKKHFLSPLFFEHMYFLLLLAVGLSFTISYYPLETLRYTIGSLILLLVYGILRTFYTTHLSLKGLESSIKIAGIFVAILNLAYYSLGVYSVGSNFIGNGVIKFGLLLDRGQPRLIGLASSDPNFTAAYLSLFFMYYMTLKKHNIEKVLFLSLIILTFSRGAIISIALTLTISFFLNKSSFKLRKILLGSILSLIFLSFTFYISKTFFRIDSKQILTSRFQEASADQGSGRISLWKSAYDTFERSPLYGIGANASLSYNKDEYKNDHYTHNTYLEVLSELGIVGMFIYLAGIYLAIKLSYSLYRRTEQYTFLLYLGLLFQMFFLSMLVSELYMLGVLIIFLYTAPQYRKKSISNED